MATGRPRSGGPLPPERVIYHGGQARESERSDCQACAARNRPPDAIDFQVSAEGARPIYAALTSERKRLTCPASSLDCEDSCSAAPSTCVAAEPVSSAAFWTPEMLVVTSWVPRAASWTLREISLVADPCCWIADAIATPI